MVGAVVCHLGHGDLIVALGECTVMGVHIADQLCVIGVPPILGRVLPGYLALDFHAVQLLVEHDILELRVILEDERDVVEVVL